MPPLAQYILGELEQTWGFQDADLNAEGQAMYFELNVTDARGAQLAKGFQDPPLMVYFEESMTPEEGVVRLPAEYDASFRKDRFWHCVGFRPYRQYVRWCLDVGIGIKVVREENGLPTSSEPALCVVLELWDECALLLHKTMVLDSITTEAEWKAQSAEHLPALMQYAIQHFDHDNYSDADAEEEEEEEDEEAQPNAQA
jgi:hypothetical protein